MSQDLAAIAILYVEDDEFIKSVVVIALEEAGFDLLIASSGQEAIAIIESRAGDLRGLLTDIDLGPGPTGWDVAKRARELIQGLPVVYVSGASAHAWTSKGVPGSVMIAKPFAPAQIVVALSSLMIKSDPVH